MMTDPSGWNRPLKIVEHLATYRFGGNFEGAEKQLYRAVVGGRISVMHRGRVWPEWAVQIARRRFGKEPWALPPDIGLNLGDVEREFYGNLP
jgi:hypothetical protein